MLITACSIFFIYGMHNCHIQNMHIIYDIIYSLFICTDNFIKLPPMDFLAFLFEP